MIFKKIGNMENVEAICHYFVRINDGDANVIELQTGLRG